MTFWFFHRIFGLSFWSDNEVFDVNQGLLALVMSLGVPKIAAGRQNYSKLQLRGAECGIMIDLREL